MLEDKLYCKFCSKECHNLNSLKQHEVRCKLNPDRKAFNQLGNYSHNNLKGQTKETNPVIAKQAAKLKNMYASGELVGSAKGKPGTMLGKKHSEDTKSRIGKSVSKSRLKGYAEGTITPAKGVGRGKYSYFKYSDKTYMLRSTYEFILAMYLVHIKNVEFSIEQIRVPSLRENRYAKTFISDFNVGNNIIEVKGIPSAKDVYIKESFEAAGYKFFELFHDDIMELKQELIDQGFNMNSLIEQICNGHDSKNYFTYVVD